MTYIVQTIDSLSNTELDSIATIEETNIKNAISSAFNFCNIKFKIQKEGLNIAFLAGEKANNEFFVTGPALFKQANTAWQYDSDFWSNLKDYVTDINCNAFAISLVKNSDIYNTFIYVANNSLYSNSTLEQNDIDLGDKTMTNIKFIHD